MKSVDQKGMVLTQAMQYRKSGKILTCTFARPFICYTTEYDKPGYRAEIHRSDDIGAYPSETLMPNGSKLWLSGGATFRDSFEPELVAYQTSLSKAIYTFTESNGIIVKRRMKFDMPEARMLHCAIPVCNDTIFFYGGINEDCHWGIYEDGNFERRLNCYTKQMLNNVTSTGFVLRNGKFAQVPGSSPCKTNHFGPYKAQCLNIGISRHGQVSSIFYYPGIEHTRLFGSNTRSSSSSLINRCGDISEECQRA